jgi:hemoglobin/transferrin/lactoferrin receptor protein
MTVGTRGGRRARLMHTVWGGAMLGLAGLGGAAAQQSGGTVTALDEVTVTAERQESTVNNSSATVSVKRAAELERKLVKKPQDLVADEPGVNIANKPNRTGATNYTIRGITDNRVKLVIDGVPVQDYPGVLSTTAGAGGPGSYTRDFIDLDSLKQVEIVRGPASALYGSDAIGGVIGFVTKDPEDFLKLFGKDWYVGLKAAYDSADKSFTTTDTLAGRAGPWSAMVLATSRWGHELKPNTNVPQSAYTSSVINPQDIWQGNLLAKLVYDTPDAGRFRLTVERFRKDVDTDVDSSLTATVTDVDGHDVTDRSRISLDWEGSVETWFADKAKAKLFFTGLERTDDTDTFATTYTQWRKDTFDQDIYGGELQLTKGFTGLGFEHTLTYGTTLEIARTERLSEGTRTVGGVTSPVISGETYPNKKFPDTTTTAFGVYAQDVAALGAWRIIPALRLDYWRLSPDAGPLDAVTDISGQTEVSLSPKLGLTYDFNDTYRGFAQYAHGFRAPPYDAVNYGFDNSLFGYRLLPNGNLKPESSDGVELGLRGRFAGGSSMQLSGFYNLYENFLKQECVTNCGSPPAGVMEYQFINLDRVRIWGLEAKGEWKARPDFSLTGAIAYANGRDMETGLPIDTVDPLTAVVGARWKPVETWTLEARLKAVAGDDDVSSANFIRTGGYSVTDLFASFEPSPHVTVNAGVMNLFDKSYFNPADIAMVSGSGQAIERYRSPGRSVAASLSIRF